MQCFAQAEAAATEALLVLCRDSRHGDAVRLRQLVGQRLEDLATAIGPEGPFRAQGGVAFKALEEFRTLESLRALVGHGVSKVALDRNGKWVAIIRHLAIRKKAEERSVQIFEQVEAEQVLADLRKKTRKLCNELERLRQGLPDAPLGSGSG